MPEVLRMGPYRIHFYALDRPEPPHVHVTAAGDQAKFWLEPVSLAAARGFSQRDLRTIERLVTEHREDFLEAWHDYFN